MALRNGAKYSRRDVIVRTEGRQYAFEKPIVLKLRVHCLTLALFPVCPDWSFAIPYGYIIRLASDNEYNDYNKHALARGLPISTKMSEIKEWYVKHSTRQRNG